MPVVGSIVAVGGGTGLSVLLRGLKQHVVAGRLGSLVGVVTVADDGGSSGRLREELGVPPPGDIRACLVALADDEDLLSRLFRFRFDNGDGLSGHSFGNLFLAALTHVTGDFSRAILTAEEILSVRGRILPATLEDVRLTAVGVSGAVYEGETAVGSSGERLASIGLHPATPRAFEPAVEAIDEADLVVLGPGSLFTSILPNLLIPEIRDAVRRSRARVVVPINLMGQPGETDGMTAVDHLDAFVEHVGTDLVDVILTNSRRPSTSVLAAYDLEGAHPVRVDEGAVAGLGIELVATDLLAPGPLVRHDPEKLATALVRLAADSIGDRP